MEKLDLNKKYFSYYTAKATPELVALDKAFFLSIEGKGNPSSTDFGEHVEAIYTVAYALKFKYKAEGKDFVVAKLEGQWWYDEQLYPNFSIEEAPAKIPRHDWTYRLLIRVPEFVSPSNIEKAVEDALKKKSLAYIPLVRYFEIDKLKAAQILHIGPFEKEGESLIKLSDFMKHKGLKRSGLHHEIYLSDFRKTPSEKLKTILREPIADSGNF